MKELSIEEKARAYDEAIKRLKDIETGKCQKTFMFTEGLFDYIFPELKESEDERIRKSLAAYFAKFKPDDMWNEDFSFGDILAWFKKQEQHKKFLDSIQIGDKVTRNKDGVLVNLSQLSRVAKKDEKQGEQKPDTQHSTEWSVSDFRTWQYIVSDVLTKKDGIGQYLDSGECKKIAKYMQEEWGRKLGKEQTQEELRKGEDYGVDGLYHAISILEKTLGKVDGYQSDDGILEHECAISAVKQLYGQKPVVWSEEDERYFNIVSAVIGSPSVQGIYDYHKVNPTDVSSWLEEHIQPQSQWKPSDEQMTALDNFIYAKYPDTERYSEPIKSLYNDLKKLREEQL